MRERTSMDESSLIRRVAPQRTQLEGEFSSPLTNGRCVYTIGIQHILPWEEFVANQAQLRANSLKYREERPGVARKGQALLQGIVRCGRCGALLHLHYSGPQGEFPEYRCSADQSQFGGTDCQRVRARALDTQVEERFLEALQPDQVTLACRPGALGTGGASRKQAMGAPPGAGSLPGQASRAAVSGGRARKPLGGSLAREAVGRAAPCGGNCGERVPCLESQALWYPHPGGPRGHCGSGQRFTRTLASRDHYQ